MTVIVVGILKLDVRDHCGIKVYKLSEYLNIEEFTICRVHSKSFDINICNILVYVLQLSFLKPILISDNFQGQWSVTAQSEWTPVTHKYKIQIKSRYLLIIY